MNCPYCGMPEVKLPLGKKGFECGSVYRRERSPACRRIQELELEVRHAQAQWAKAEKRSERVQLLDYYEDSRGWIRKIESEGLKFNLLYSVAGSCRSGDFHPCTQCDAVISGKAEVVIRGDDESRVILAASDSISIPAGQPHIFHFLRDTLMIEWWDGEFSAEYYKPYRDIVEKSLQNS